ncbi:hypothetical protein Q5P01_024259 [Channa striata]|uniref:Uncharacterized protein n=1 Tax=Channa striata TaxID=64152 RepID=A0AA88LQA2_CHASR|nr:hypothetical protein Q5P01_024259 [Channa striata]
MLISQKSGLDSCTYCKRWRRCGGFAVFSKDASTGGTRNRSSNPQGRDLVFLSCGTPSPRTQETPLSPDPKLEL